eukprot:snap_masked-scaffold_4-processed-gene-21.38-mRNA-1 protein AED:1.00 eAED:1.00 QI:0/-1/0/0/-1/1/1/0/61
MLQIVEWTKLLSKLIFSAKEGYEVEELADEDIYVFTITHCVHYAMFNEVKICYKRLGIKFF